jgi:hypothetical protein
LASCGHSPAEQTKSDEQLLKEIKHFAATPTPWPSYLAKDYGKPGQPHLTKMETRLIQLTTAVVMPCQLAFLRYAFPKNQDLLPMVLFFASEPAAWPHVLWQRKVYYKPVEGEAFPASDTGIKFDYSIERDVREAKCPP